MAKAKKTKKTRKTRRRKKIKGNPRKAKKSKPISSTAKKRVFLREEKPVITPVGALEDFRHATDKPQFWAGVALLALAGVMFAHGTANTAYLAAGLGGALALIIE